MGTEIDRAVELLFPESGRRARDVKFFFQPGTATVGALTQQIVACFAARENPSSRIVSIDEGLTV